MHGRNKHGLLFGFGNMGDCHYNRYKNLGATITVIENDPKKRELAEKLGLSAYATLDDFLLHHKKNEIDFIDICLPTPLHFSYLQEIMMKFHDSPLPIIVEKPVVLKREEIDKLRKLAVLYPRIIFVAEVEHYNKRINDFLKGVDPEYIYISRMVNIDFFLQGNNGQKLDIRERGGLIRDVSVHNLCILNPFGQATIIDGEFIKKKFGPEIECIAEAKLELQYNIFETNTFKVTVKDSWLSTNTEKPIILRIEVIEKNGNKKTLVIDDYTIRGPSNDDSDPFYLELKTFLECIETNKTNHPLEEYLQIVKLTDTISLLADLKFASMNRPTYRHRQFKPADESAVVAAENSALLTPRPTQ